MHTGTATITELQQTHNSYVQLHLFYQNAVREKTRRNNQLYICLRIPRITRECLTAAVHKTKELKEKLTSD